VLDSIASDLVLGQNAIVQVVKFSPIFKNKFSRFVSQLTEGSCARIKDLASAKHRFGSHTKPFGRAVLWFVPLLQTAQGILDERKKSSSEGSIAFEWMSSLTVERCLLIAMMADTGEEVQVLNLFLDADDYDKSILPIEVGRFLQRLSFLVQHSGLEKTGYTKHMIQILETGQMIVLDKPQMLGGPGSVTQAVLK
jgi:hypothetical protein